MTDTLYDIFTNGGKDQQCTPQPPKPMDTSSDNKQTQDICKEEVISYKREESSLQKTIEEEGKKLQEDVKKREKKQTSAPKKKRKSTEEGGEPPKKQTRKHPIDKHIQASPVTQQDKRHFAGYSMLKSESDKIDRTIEALKRKKEKRESTGKTDPTVCGMFNERLLKFFKIMRGKYDEEFVELKVDKK